MTEPRPLNDLHEDHLSPNTKAGVAGVYSLFRTAGQNSGGNGAQTILNGITNYGDAIIVMSAAEALWNLRRTAKLFYVMNIALGLACFPLFLRWDYHVLPSVRTGLIIYGVFVCLAAAAIYPLYATRWLRGNILPYKGTFLMHESPTLMKIMQIKVVFLFLASSLTLVYMWVIARFAAWLAEVSLHPIVPMDNPVVVSIYPTPVPPAGHPFVFIPFAVISGVVLSLCTPNGGIFGNIWPTIIVSFLIPLFLSAIVYWSDTATNIIAFLSRGTNALILFETDLVLKASGVIPLREDEDIEVYRAALYGANEMDTVLDELFEKEAAMGVT